MKKVILAIFVAGLMLFVLTNAYAITFSPTPADLYDLTHQEAYTWGISWSVPGGELITSASLFIDNINNWKNEYGNDRLFIHLLDDTTLGVTKIPGADDDYPLNGAAADAFAGQGILLTTYIDNYPDAAHRTTAEDWTYNFTDTQIGTLTSYAANGIFGFGFDPDCHYWNDGITFTVNTAPIPEPATLSLLGLGLVGVLGLRKKRLAS